MSSPASIKKHPLHPMLVGLPIGLWVFALVCDLMHALSGNAVWQSVSTYCIAGGIVGAILAAVPGLIDYFSIHEAEMRRIANLHLAVNLGAVLLFGINLWTEVPLADGQLSSRCAVDCRSVGYWHRRLVGWRNGVRQGHGRRSR